MTKQVKKISNLLLLSRKQFLDDIDSIILSEISTIDQLEALLDKKSDSQLQSIMKLFKNEKFLLIDNSKQSKEIKSALKRYLEYFTADYI